MWSLGCRAEGSRVGDGKEGADADETRHGVTVL